MRLFISADIEGIVHVTSLDHLMPGGFEYETARRWMTDTVLAAVEAARENGFTEVIVADAHGNAQNILPDLIPDYVQVVRGWPRPLSMMQGIDIGTFDAAMLIGYHTGSMTPAGVMAHNFSRHLSKIVVNGQILTETSISAGIAGAFGVPVILVSGDDVYCDEALATLGDVETVPVKVAIGRQSSLNPSSAIANSRIRDGVSKATRRLGSFNPFTIAGPLDVELTFRTHSQTEVLSLLPGSVRSAAHTIRFEYPSILDLAKFIEFLGHYDPAKY